MIDGKALWRKLEAYKYPLLTLLLGVLILLFPTRKEPAEAEKPESTIEQILSRAEGVGRVHVLLSENGALIVCDGASNAGVRLDILRAIGSYTGFGSDKITVLKMSN